jgi:hypothetical protein
MAATYDASSISTNIVSYARARFRDVGGLSGTVVGKPLMLDEEYQGFVSRLGNAEGLAQAAEALAAGFAQKVQQFSESGGVDVVWPRRAEFYLELARNIRLYGVDMTNGALVGAYAPTTPIIETDERLMLL